MKRIFALILVLVMALSLLTACNKPQDPPPEPEDTGTTTEIPVENEEGDEAQSGPVRGGWVDDVYTNDYTGIEYTLPSGWQALSDEQVAEMMSIGAEELGETGTDLTEYMEKTGSFYDAVVMNPSTSSNIIFGFENLPALSGILLDESGYLDAAKNQLDAALPYDYTIEEGYTNYTLGGRNYTCMSVTVNDVAMSQHYLVTKIGSTACLILVTLVGGETLDDALAAFN